MAYMPMTTEPSTAIMGFIEWVCKFPRKNTGGFGDDSDVVLVPHSSMNHDHAVLMKTTMVWGINPPK